jgi:PAS domain S-box-containing protein
VPSAELGDSYGSAVDERGIGWIELGAGRVGRFDPHQAAPGVEFLGDKHGLVRNWVEIYVLEGVARFHVSNVQYQFDGAQRRFVEDRELLVRHPELATAGGRPVMDSLNRLWFTIDGAPHAIDYSPAGGKKPISIPPIDFPPTIYTLEDDGVAWISDSRRLARVDLKLPSPPQIPLRALITSVQFSASGRQVFDPGSSIGALDYSDNSLGFQFAAPANPFGLPVTFEVLLEGSGGQWVSTGTVGSATFNRLKEGRYVFRVRPVARGSAPGAEAHVAFSVRPPWFRTTFAWVIYVGSAAGIVGFAAWLSSFLQRRENERLEHLVTQRTSELNATNSQLGRQIVETTEKSVALAASEERYRTLNTELEHRVETRTAELSLSNRELQQRESLFRLVFEHAPVGISWKRADLGDVFHLNPTFRRILGLSHDELMDHTLLARLVHRDDASRQEARTRSIESGASDSFTLEERFVLADGRVIWGLLSVAVVRDPAGAIIQEIGILEDITPRKQAEEQLAATYKNLVTTSRIAGMAEVATGVLHNVGNVLNSLNVSSNLLGDANQQSKVSMLVKLSALVDEHAADLGTYLMTDPKGKLIPDLLHKLAENSLVEREWFATEIAAMQKNIDYIKAIIAMQQNYATTAGAVETIEASSLFEDALRMNERDLSRHQIRVVRDFTPVSPLTIEKDKALQILIDLIHNAREACDEFAATVGGEKIVTVSIHSGSPGYVRLIVRDNGIGIPAENLTRIFSHGFTTRPGGHGFALHTSILAAKAMKGSLTASSDGPGKGASFTLELPINPPALKHAPTGSPEVEEDTPRLNGPNASLPANAL